MFMVHLQVFDYYTFSNDDFFPLDNKGWKDSNLGGTNNNVQHNFAYCYEIHAHFSYLGGEVFSFEGDDDVWVYPICILTSMLALITKQLFGQKTGS